MTHHIREASSERDYQAIGALIVEYVAWLRARYQGDAWFITEVLDKQSLYSELDNLATCYGPPQGRAFVAEVDGAICGCGAYRALADGSCEMKRVYVGAGHQGLGIGRAICMALTAAARADGYTLMKLDTGKRLNEAAAMYASLGFRECAPYYDYPENLVPYLSFMDLRLVDGAAGKGGPA